MALRLKPKQKEHLVILKSCEPKDVIELCKLAFDYLSSGPGPQAVYEDLGKKHGIVGGQIQNIIEALICLLIDATKINATTEQLQMLQQEVGITSHTVDVLSQFVTSKRHFIEGSIKSSTLRAYRLVNLEWRLEVRIASRSLLSQTNIFVTMKLYLHTEPKNENRDLLKGGENEIIHPDERRNRKDVLVQTDLSTLLHMIHTLEGALIESKTRRVRNIVNAIV